LAKTKISCFWKKPEFAGEYQAAVSLHSHTNRSKESLHFIPKIARKWFLLHWAFESQRKKTSIPVDFVRAYWTPPLTPKLAFEVERNQIETVLGLTGFVSLTDHDNIEAPTLLRVLPESRRTPFALEWSVPFEGAVFHLGVHNLPNSRAQEIVADLAAYTRNPSGQHLSELIAMLDQSPEVLIIFNHPLWDLRGMGQQQYRHVLNQFLQHNVRFLHAFELNGTRGWKENNGVIRLADRWKRLLISGGDRHGREPSGALNLTRAGCFSEFVREIRLEQRSHVLFMPQYAQPKTIRMTQEFLDIISDYPEYPAGSRRWDDRVFHPDQATNTDRPISTFWNAPPAYIGRVFSAVRLLEKVAVRRALRHVCRGLIDLHLLSDVPYQATL
jgi:hypothetical protein